MKNTIQRLSNIIFMLLATITTFSQTEYQLDSIQKFDWDTNTSAFDMNSREHFTYDNGGTKETSYIWYLPNGTVWNPAIRYFKTYDGNNNVIEKLNETFDSTLALWNASTKEFYTYNGSQNVILFEDFLSSDSGITWDIPRTEREYLYNTDNLITELTSRYYDAPSMTMIDLAQGITSYNGLNIAEEITKTWSRSDGVWLNNIKTEYTFNGNLPIQKNLFSWQTSDWDSQAYLQVINTYDGDLLTEEIILRWNSSGSIWENSSRTTRTFDTNGNIQEVLTYDWDETSSTWLSDRQELWYWSEAGAILSVPDENKISVIIYPNPTTEYFTIGNLKEKATVAMYDVQGKQVMDYDLDNLQNPKIYTNQFGSGIYFLKIFSNTGTVSKKLIIK